MKSFLLLYIAVFTDGMLQPVLRILARPEWCRQLPQLHPEHRQTESRNKRICCAELGNDALDILRIIEKEYQRTHEEQSV